MKLIIAGGGPAAICSPASRSPRQARVRWPDAEITFVGTARGIEARVLPGLGWPLELIEVSGLKTVGMLGALRGLVRLPRALVQARNLVRRLAPDVVIGVGGYASGPVVLMAKLLGVPTGICEQNSIPGLTNKILGRLVRGVFLAFDDTRRFFAAKRIVMTGNPVRRGLVAKLQGEAAAADGKLHVLVCGGSQGAVAVNQLASAALSRSLQRIRSRSCIRPASAIATRPPRSTPPPASRPTSCRSSRIWRAHTRARTS